MIKSNQIKLGFVGVGFVCQQCHLPTFSVNPSFKIEAIADPFEDLRNSIGNRYGIKNKYSSHLEMLEKSDIDAVVITLPRKLSFSVIRDCLKRNKWIFTEKPLCLNLENAYEILDLSIKHRRSVYVGYMKTSDDGTKILKNKFKLFPTNKLKTIKAFCYSGYSYASPFGDIKGKQLKTVNYDYENFPTWLNKELEVSYEQYLNTFTHITHTLEFITEGKLKFVNYLGNRDGEGFLSATISCLDIPISIESIKGKQNEWIEGIEFIYEDLIAKINYPAAFLRNVPAKINISKGIDYSFNENIRPQWSWSFMNQTSSFYEMINSKEINRNNLISSINQIKLVSDLYRTLS